MKLGFIGFGGAAYGLAKGLQEAGPIDITFYDSLLGADSVGAAIRERALETGAQPRDSLGALVGGAEIIVSCVTGSVARDVAGQAAHYLTPHHAYVDVNTASPKTMEEVYSLVRNSGVKFTDVAMMGGIPTFLHRVPCLASGNGAAGFKTLMDPYGMDITCVGESPGQASAIKMFRSIFMKGFLSLLIEMLTASRTYRVDEIVMDSISATMEKNDFLETTQLQLSKGVISSERMSHEMEAVVQTLAEMDLPSTMSLAARDTLEWCSSLGLADHFGHKMPDSLTDILDVLAQKAQQ